MRRSSRELVRIHEFVLIVFNAKKRTGLVPVKTRFEAFAALKENAGVFRAKSTLLTRLQCQKKDRQIACLFFGAEDEIRTRATVSHTTPLAGEPLEPLGYFCKLNYSNAIILYHIFFVLSKLFAW